MKLLSKDGVDLELAFYSVTIQQIDGKLQSLSTV